MKTMTVMELIRELSQHDPDTLVVMGCDRSEPTQYVTEASPIQVLAGYNSIRYDNDRRFWRVLHVDDGNQPSDIVDVLVLG